MRILLRLGIICLILLVAFPAAATEPFAFVRTTVFTWEGIFTAGRLSTLGGSDLADRSPATFLINPAPLNTGNGVGLSYDHADYFGNTEFHTYAGGAEWNDWRLNIAVQDFVTHAVVGRTIYLPADTSKTFDVRDRMTVIGLSYDLGNALLEEYTLHWLVGAAWRRYSASFEKSDVSANSFDLGTTLNWRTEHRIGWTGLTGAVTWQNVSDATLTYDEHQASVPRLLRTGLTIETAFDRAGRADELLKLLLAYTHSFRLGESYSSDSEHVGVEALFLNALALRYGHSTLVAGGVASWGAGIVLDKRLLGPVSVEVDWGTMSYNNFIFHGEKTIWGARALYSF